MSQESCLDCYRKHIATAMAFEDEYFSLNPLGESEYPEHKWFAIGELNAAMKEVIVSYPELALHTRKFYKLFLEDDVKVPSADLIKLATVIKEKEIIEEDIDSEDLNNTEGR